MDFNAIDTWFTGLLEAFVVRATSAEFYAQCGLVLFSVIIALTVASWLKNSAPVLRDEPGEVTYQLLKQFLYRSRDLLFPLLNIVLLAVSIEVSEHILGQSWLVRIALGFSVVFLIYTAIDRYISKDLVKLLVKWIAIPIAVLQVVGWLDDVVTYLDGLAMQIGNIRISAYAVARVLIFGSVLFWLGRVTNRTGQQIIRNQQDLDIGTREVFAKLFEVALFIVIFLLLLQVMGINLTALAVFGGALGVGLGFGLQSIASNFISGIILLLDRSLTVGDYIETEEGHFGIIRELNMRSTTVETFDGKDIMIPNEKFITSSFTNWTHKNKKQRYSLEFSVAYSTDLDKMFPLIREAISEHPDVLSGEDLPIEERPDAEILSFGDSGINILVEFWMEGVDDGRNRVGADLLYIIWSTLRDNDIQIPFPQREVRILNREDGEAQS